MSTTTARIAGFPVQLARPVVGPAKANAEPPRPAEPPAAGWDPYEVWRTRVLLPRLQEQALESPLPAKPTPVASKK